MSGVLALDHSHEPLFRVVRQDWADPLDASHSRRHRHRWNTPDFPALYCCCSEWVSRAVVLDLFRFVGVDWSDLQPGARPQLVEISWKGSVVDVASTDGVVRAGFSPDYPEGASRQWTQQAAARWHEEGIQGVIARSASVARSGYKLWEGGHERWSELTIFVQNCGNKPVLLRRRRDRRWLSAVQPPALEPSLVT